jgi:hypothetical protein
MGLRFAEHPVLAAIGIDASDKQDTLDLREGATENATACKVRLADLIERGLPAERSLLFVPDFQGSCPILPKAVSDTFGPRAFDAKLS